MKKLIFSGIAFLALALIVSCSQDTEMSNVAADEIESPYYAAPEYLSRASYWDGVIGEEVNGQYVITADTLAIKADFEEVLANQGRATTLQEIFIEGQTAVNDPTSKAYFLMGIDKNGITIATMLEKQDFKFFLRTDNGFAKTVTCEGCLTGCNLAYMVINGKSVPYCNENGCSTYNCTKSESEFN